MTKRKTARRNTHRAFELTPAVLKTALREVQGNSDRSMALVHGAIIDSMVHAIVRKRLLSGLHGKSQLFDGPSAPLGTTFARNAFLYETGVISSVLYADLETIRKIRNLFAHEWAIHSFAHPQIAGLVDKLQPNDRELPTRVKERRAKWNQPVLDTAVLGAELPHRSRFGLAIVTIWVVLYSIRKDSAKPKKCRPESIYAVGGKLDAALVFKDVGTLDEAGIKLVEPRRTRRRTATGIG